MLFEELGLTDPLVRAVLEAGYTSPTPIQELAIPHAMAGKDLLGCAETGTGKTAAFALPILHRLATDLPRGTKKRFRVLVLSPTRELALQIGESFRDYGKHMPFRHVCIFGGVNQRPQTQALYRGVDVVVATPGRLIDLMNQGYVDLGGIEILVLDEADRMLDMGFMPDIRRILEGMPERRQTLLFSATMPPEIRRLADAILRDPVNVKTASERPSSDLIAQSVYKVPSQRKAQLLVHILRTEPLTRALVFTRTKRGADFVVRQLATANLRAEAIHSDKTQSARQRTLANFKSNRTPILVATDIAARGIDVDAISHVLNFDLPDQPETYVHRIGRTGRAGVAGKAVSFCASDERRYLQAIERMLRHPITVETEHPTYLGGAEEESLEAAPRPRPRPPRTDMRPSRFQSKRPAERANDTRGPRPSSSLAKHKRRRRPSP